MSRLPFDPSAAAGADPAAPAPSRQEAGCLTVSELSELIKRTLEQRVPAPIRVIGEISNLSAKHHWYFSLKDEDAVISCVVWASAAKGLLAPRDGERVIATGHVSHYGPQGRTQLYVRHLEPAGAGELERRFRALCEQLRTLGYFDEQRKRPLPPFPRRVAVITSAGSAAAHDVVATAAHRCPAVALLIVDVKVQGEGAAAQVVRAIDWVDEQRDRLGVEAILVTRGGGSMEDLWAFNERLVADAVLRCTLPVVAAIGHESDVTIIELVADMRAATPTQAIMRLVPDRGELRQHLDHLDHRLRFLLHRVLERQRQRLSAILRHEIFRDPVRLLARGRERIGHLERHLYRAVRQRLAEQQTRIERLAGRWAATQPTALIERRRQRLALLEDRLARAVLSRLDQRERLLDLQRHLRRAVFVVLRQAGQRVDGLEARQRALDPRQILGRGFSYATDERGAIIRSVEDIARGEVLSTHVRDGVIRSIVGAQRGHGARAGRERRDQMDLFEPGQ